MAVDVPEGDAVCVLLLEGVRVDDGVAVVELDGVDVAEGDPVLDGVGRWQGHRRRLLPRGPASQLPLPAL